MISQARGQLLAEFREATRRPVAWAQDGGPLGDFEDRENTLEVFDVQDFEQRAMFSSLRGLREKARGQLGRAVRVVFHSPQATTRHYAHVRPAEYRFRLTLVAPSSAASSGRGGLVDEDVFGDSRPPRVKVA